MRFRNGAFAGLLFLAACRQDSASSNLDPSQRSLGTVPSTEVAVWQKVAAKNLPDVRYLQAAAFDDIRRVVVMFGGIARHTDRYGNTTLAANGETWEWSPATGKWTDRTSSGMPSDAGSAPAPDPRSGAGMVFDSARNKIVLFGGRAGSGYDLEDTWEWDPTTGAWTDVTAAGSHPLARCQHGMVFEKATGKILLFGGGRSDTSSSDATVIAASLGDTWEYDPATYIWKQLPVTSGPSARHAFGMVWDSARSKAVLFGGLQTDKPGTPGTPLQDTWQLDGTTSAWTERTAVGTKPSSRFGQAMAFDGSRGKVLLFGGFDVNTGSALTDLWELDPATFAWTERPTKVQDLNSWWDGVMYASLLSDDAGARIELVAGAAIEPPTASGGAGGSRDIGIGDRASGERNVWELDPSKAQFTDRSPGSGVPDRIFYPAFAYCPANGKTYLCGGEYRYNVPPYEDMLGEVCEWDGQAWACPAAQPSGWYDAGAAMAYDPARNSLILFGGIGSHYYSDPSDGTWELGLDGTLTSLQPPRSPTGVSRVRMVTDTTRNKLLLFGGDNVADVWEWDGAAVTWTKRTYPTYTSSPAARTDPVLTYDEGREKMFLFDGQGYGPDAATTVYWEWDPITAGWASYNTGDMVTPIGSGVAGAYDSIRRRQVIVGNGQTWEIDTRTKTLYIRTTATVPPAASDPHMAFDSRRGVMVLEDDDETWEYKVTNLANGAGCTAAFAASCASGFCVDGVCCDVAACTGACQSCNVAGSEGTCVQAAPGTEVPGSCTAGMACDGSGACKSKNGQACAAAAECASGFCADGVCCDSACAGTCASCNQAGRTGRCTAYAVGTDPEKECPGTGKCKATCDGVSACAFPQSEVVCSKCYYCDGAGECSAYDFFSCGTGGSSGNSGGSGGNSGGSGGNSGGSGGHALSVGGGGGSQKDAAGDAGTPNPHKSGCGCVLGEGVHSEAGSTAALLLVGAALSLMRKRRRKGGHP